MKQKELCLDCCEEQEYEVHTETRTIPFEGIHVSFEAKVHICTTCKKDIPNDEVYNQNYHKYLEAIAKMKEQNKKTPSI